MEIEKLLQSCNKTLKNIQSISFPNLGSFSGSQNRLVYDELMYDQTILSQEHKSLINNLAHKQHHVYDTIMNATKFNKCGITFEYGYRGIGKMFVWRTLSAAIRSKGEVVLNGASSGIPSLLLPGERTTHSQFAIPINSNEDSTCKYQTRESTN